MKKGFTITELLVAVGLLAAVFAVAGMIFNYSIDAQRTAAATAEIMRTLRAITDQLSINLGGLKKDGYLILWSQQATAPATDRLDALYFFGGFAANHFQSWYDPTKWSSEARIFLGHSQATYVAGELPGDLALDFLLLVPGLPPPPPSIPDCCATDFATCRPHMTGMANPIISLGVGGEVPQNILSTARPEANSTDVRSLLAQHVGSFEVEWTYGWFDSTAPDKILWWGINNTFAASVGPNLVKSDGITPPTALEVADIISYETPGPPYTVDWNTTNQADWPKALKFTFTLYDSKGIIKGGRTFEYIVYIN